MFVREEGIRCGCGAMVYSMQVHECSFQPPKIML